jgi:peptidyl-tRNA hydrolase
MKTDEFRRLQIGIGRPVSKDEDVVSKYVLSNFSSSEK